MKRYIKSAVAHVYTLKKWLDTYRSAHDVIALVVNDAHIVINDRTELLCCELKRYLDSTSLSRFSDYLVMDVEASFGANYTVYLTKPY